MMAGKVGHQLLQVTTNCFGLAAFIHPSRMRTRCHHFGRDAKVMTSPVLSVPVMVVISMTPSVFSGRGIG